MEGPLHISVCRSLPGYRSRAAGLADLVARHAGILKRVEARDPAGAADRMRAHLEATRRELRAAFRLEAVTGSSR